MRTGTGAPAGAGLQTELCRVLGIRHPVIQSGMARVAGPELVAEVSRAGGLGILAGLNVPPAELRKQIRRVRELTDRPFGVNQWLHPAFLRPVDVAQIPDERVQAVQKVLNGFRARVGAPASNARPVQPPELIAEQLEVIIEERVPVWSLGLGCPTREMTRRCHEAGIRVMAMVTTVEEARAVVEAGCDIVVAQGSEAGGHRSTWRWPQSREAGVVGAIALVPQIVDAVSVPVVAAGGIVDGRGLVAALALGAQGVLLGTRFVATRESIAPPFWKDALLRASADATVVTNCFSGLYARALRNAYTDEYAASGAPLLPPMVHSQVAQDLFVAAAARGDSEVYPLMSGQGTGLLKTIPSAAEVVERIVEEARTTLEALARVHEVSKGAGA